MSEPTDKDRDESQRQVKVTDKRMFGPDGELREEYSFLGQKDQTAKPASDEARSSPETPEGGSAEASTERPSPISTDAGAGSNVSTEAPRDVPRDVPGYEAGAEKASFLHLISILAEPVAIYLGDVQLPDGRSAENLEMARLHIDLLEVLRDKTQGNCTADETAILDDLLYRLRMRYVQKSGGSKG